MISQTSIAIRTLALLTMAILLTACGGGGGGGGSSDKPVANFTISDDNPRINESISFNASGSTGQITSYAWSFGDSTTGNGSTATKTYTSAATVTVQLTVTDEAGETATASKNVTVRGENQAPTAAFTADVTTGRKPLVVQFDASGSSDSDGSVSTYAWDFGDGTSATGVTTSKTYEDQNTYTVTLTITDNEGLTDTTTESIEVLGDNIAPVGAFTATPIGNGQVLFDASASTDSDGSIANYAWDFGDGNTSTDTVVTHTFDLAGQPTADFTVSLQLEDNEGTFNTQGSTTVTAYQDIVRIVEIGDSITHGQQDNFPLGEVFPTYRYPLWKKLIENNKYVDFIGGRDDLRNLDECPESACANVTATDGSGRFHTFDQNHQATWGIKASQVAASIGTDLNNSAYDNGIDVALIHLGTNELLQSEPASNASTAIQSIIDSLKAKDADVRILVARIIPLHSSQTGWDQVGTLNGLIDTLVAANANVFSVNMNAVVSTAELRDSVHPDHTGEQDMADEWYNALTGPDIGL